MAAPKKAATQRAIKKPLRSQEHDDSLQELSEDSPKVCFIITPIGADYSEARRRCDGLINEVIEPVVKEYGYQVKVAHRISESGLIGEQIINYLYSAELCICDLSDLNANVMYELGIRHCVGKPVINICSKGTSLPFDISSARTIFYTNDMYGGGELKEALRNAIDSTEQEDQDAYKKNPVYSALGVGKILRAVKESDGNDVSEVLSVILKKLNSLNSQDSVPIPNVYPRRLYREVAYKVTGSKSLDPKSHHRVVLNNITNVSTSINKAFRDLPNVDFNVDLIDVDRIRYFRPAGASFGAGYCEIYVKWFASIDQDFIYNFLKDEYMKHGFSLEED